MFQSLEAMRSKKPSEVRVVFEPKPDITTFELAQILSRCDRLYGLIVVEAVMWEAVAPELKRHFSEFDPAKP